MTDPTPESALPPTTVPLQESRGAHARFFALRQPLPLWQSLLLGLLCLACCFGLWWWLTLGESAEERIVTPAVLPSPAETFGDLHELWFDMALTRNTYASLKRVTLGFALATVVGVPIGVLCGCFGWARAFFAPIVIFGRNIPIAALVPLTFSMFGIGEQQKIMFIFFAVVAFIVADAATAIADISARYVDTAFTLGASRWQVIIKVLFPLALPNIFNSLRLLFGLAFGYIMLAELVRLGSDLGGLGSMINTAQRLGKKSYIYLILILIPVVALVIDRFLFWVQRELFPYQYGGAGVLNQLVRFLLHRHEEVKQLIFRPKDAAPFARSKPTSENNHS